MISNGRGGFFCVDRWTWGKVCDLGRMNEAVAYLIMGQGTGADNRYTRWSVTALEKYAGIGWERGKAAIEALVQLGLLARTKDHTKAKPRYELPAAQEIVLARFNEKIASLSEYERLTLAQLRANPGRRITAPTRRILRILAGHGLVHEQACDKFEVLEPPALDRDPIWLPNAIVLGVNSAEDSPVRRMRVTQDVWALRLLVDLYHAQYLADYGGINPAVLRQEYYRELVGERGIYRVWAFRPSGRHGSFRGPLGAHQNRPQEKDKDHPLWDSVRILEGQGLLSYAPHLFEGDPASSQAEVIHPCNGEPIEADIGTAALRAGLAMLPDFKRERLPPGCWLIPVERGIPNAQMVGVARLRHRPHTAKTSAWFRDLNTVAQHWIANYRNMAESAESEKTELSA